MLTKVLPKHFSNGRVSQSIDTTLTSSPMKLNESQYNLQLTKGGICDNISNPHKRNGKQFINESCDRRASKNGSRM